MEIDLVYEGEWWACEITSASFSDYKFRLWFITSVYISSTTISYKLRVNELKEKKNEFNWSKTKLVNKMQLNIFPNLFV